MSVPGPLVAREAERDRLLEAVANACGGEGSLILLAGEAGIGKTRLAEEVASLSDALVLRGRASPGVSSPYGVLVTALRSHARSEPDAFAGLGALTPHLAVILPELGVPARASDRPTLFEAVRRALELLARDRHVLLVLDDLHWSDAATLELIGGLAESLAEICVVVLGTYRSDGLPRDHALRRLRNDLRRAGRLQEVVFEPLDRDGTRELLTATLGEAASDSLVAAIHDRTVGVPFFVEELANALQSAGVLRDGPRGLELAAGGEVPLPDTVRDAVLLAIAELPDPTRAAADAAAVAGDEFDLDVVAETAGGAAVADLLADGLIAEDGDGRASFHHALARESIYADIPWLRRRSLHRSIAESLEARGAPASEGATPWGGGRRRIGGRDALGRCARRPPRARRVGAGCDRVGGHVRVPRRGRRGSP